MTKIKIIDFLAFLRYGAYWAAGHHFVAIAASLFTIISDHLGFSVLNFEYLGAKRFASAASDAQFLVHFGFGHMFRLNITIISIKSFTINCQFFVCAKAIPNSLE